METFKELSNMILKEHAKEASLALGTAIYNITEILRKDDNIDEDRLNIYVSDLEELDRIVFYRYHDD